MNSRFKDTDLREALRRKYADTPPLPVDFMTSIERQTRTKRRAGGIRVAAITAVAIAASIALLVMLVNPHQTVSEKGGLAMGYVPRPPRPTYLAPLDLRTSPPSTYVPRKSAPDGRQSGTRQGTTPLPKDSELDDDQESGDPNLHYAASVTQEDTIDYQDPAHIDDFIAKLAAFHDVKQGDLNCSLSVDSNLVSAVYVFPDKKEIDVFARLLQVACWYNCETPGYFLNFSQRQFIFQLHDQRKQLKYSWIAERIAGKILLYGVNAPIGAEFSTACYQEYRDQLMNKRSINTKTIDI